MAPRKDETGNRYGRLVVESYVRSLDGAAIWRCRCDCGSIHQASGHELRRGTIRSCGCLVHVDLTGQRYGRLVVEARATADATYHANRHVAWVCRCDCGERATIAGASLRRGKTRSCGCLRRELARERARKLHGYFGLPRLLEEVAAVMRSTRTT